MYKNYIENILLVHEVERLEVYYYSTIATLIRTICGDNNKVVTVSENKRSTKIHDKSIYSTKKGLQDLIIVNNSYSYENPQKPIVTIEIKRPKIKLDQKKKIIQYIPIDIKGYEKQLLEELTISKYGLFTDCISWYFIIKEKDGIRQITKPICLLEREGKSWGWIDYETVNENCTIWQELLFKIETFILKAERLT